MDKIEKGDHYIYVGEVINAGVRKESANNERNRFLLWRIIKFIHIYNATT
nr:hypothetical protein [Ureibacillus thermosphaericus]